MPKDAEQKGLTSNFMKKDTVHFFDDVIMRYFDRFPEVIVAGYDWVFNGKVPDRSLVPAIDLDNGRLLLANNLAEMPALWV
ncbi:MAG: hypothetical protein A2Z97_04395 [Bdellovibrionales bacterium GWB1_52_6]|nr:MAG: hypothetical protein A2Z97_04395 [Bdellovibrionales bacterium GWB1_52_6]